MSTGSTPVFSSLRPDPQILNFYSSRGRWPDGSYRGNAETPVTFLPETFKDLKRFYMGLISDLPDKGWAIHRSRSYTVLPPGRPETVTAREPFNEIKTIIPKIRLTFKRGA